MREPKYDRTKTRIQNLVRGIQRQVEHGTMEVIDRGSSLEVRTVRTGIVQYTFDRTGSVEELRDSRFYLLDDLASKRDYSDLRKLA